MTVGYLFSGVITHLPILAVLVAGLIVVGTRKARLGPRSATFAQLGLGLLALGQVLEIIWWTLLPEIISSMDYSSRNYGIMTLIVGIILAVMLAAGLALLIAALATRTPAAPSGPFGSPPTGPGGPYGPTPQPGSGPYGSATGPGGPFAGAPGSQQPPPSGHGAPVGSFHPPNQAPGPDAGWSPGAPGSEPGPPPTAP